MRCAGVNGREVDAVGAARETCPADNSSGRYDVGGGFEYANPQMVAVEIFPQNIRRANSVLERKGYCVLSEQFTVGFDGGLQVHAFDKYYYGVAFADFLAARYGTVRIYGLWFIFPFDFHRQAFFADRFHVFFKHVDEVYFRAALFQVGSNEGPHCSGAQYPNLQL